MITAWEDNKCVRMCEILQQFYFILFTILDETSLDFLVYFHGMFHLRHRKYFTPILCGFDVRINGK